MNSWFGKAWSNSSDWISAVILELSILLVLGGAARLVFYDPRNIVLFLVLLAAGAFLTAVMIHSLRTGGEGLRTAVRFSGPNKGSRAATSLHG